MTVIYKRKTAEKTGYLVKLYRFQNGEEETLFLKFDPKKIDGHAIKQEERRTKYERLASDCKKIIEKPFCDLDKIASGMMPEQRRYVSDSLERIAMRAGQMARYFDERHGYGCGDQGHDKAVKSLNKAGKAIWCKAFGYNEYLDINF